MITWEEAKADLLPLLCWYVSSVWTPWKHDERQESLGHILESQLRCVGSKYGKLACEQGLLWHSISPIRSAQMLTSAPSTDGEKLFMSEVNIRPFNVKINTFSHLFHLHAQCSHLCLIIISLLRLNTHLVHTYASTKVSLALNGVTKKFKKHACSSYTVI